MTVIYLDVLLAINLFVNYFLLSSVAKITKHPLRGFRNLAASLILSLGSLIILLPPLALFINVAVRILMAFVGVIIAFGFGSLKNFCKRTGALLSATLLFGGTMTVLFDVTHVAGLYVENGMVYYDLSPVMVVIATLLCYIVLRLFRKNFGTDDSPDYVQLHLQHGNCIIGLTAQVDTGFALHDLYNDRPLIMVTPSTAKKLFGKQPLTYRLLPFETVDGSGVLQSGLCERMVAVYEKKQALFTRVVVAVAPQEWKQNFQALVGKDLMERMEWDDSNNQKHTKTMVDSFFCQTNRLYRRQHRVASSAEQRGGTPADGKTQARGPVGAGKTDHP